MLFGVIDIGSTSVRLMMTDGEKVEKRVNTTRLAENMDEMNTLQPVSIERTAQAVAEYYFVAMQNGAEDVYAYATEAVRSAKNKYRFVDRVRELCGLEIDILDKRPRRKSGSWAQARKADAALSTWAAQAPKFRSATAKTYYIPKVCRTASSGFPQSSAKESK